MGQMIILSIQTEDEELKDSFETYKSLVKSAVDEQDFMKRVQLVKKSNRIKEELQTRLATLHKTHSSISELADNTYEEVKGKVLQSKLKTGLFLKDDLKLLLEEQKEVLPAEIYTHLVESYQQLNENEYLLFWYIEENEWRALLSN
ncbi:hypothetical protein ACQCT3_02230 [Sutcliffiella horikoshii]|uniref:hypothetical protein n=1 Tax=Sutcliffiella horikoshii TaxID=79883 RepID=UPI003CEE956B